MSLINTIIDKQPIVTKAIFDYLHLDEVQNKLTNGMIIMYEHQIYVYEGGVWIQFKAYSCCCKNKCN